MNCISIISRLMWLWIAAVFLYAFITPPFQVPDESQHFFRAYQISLGSLKVLASTDEAGQITMGYPLPRSIIDMERSLPREKPVTYKRYLVDDLLKTWKLPQDNSDTAYVAFPNVGSYAPTLYAPQAAGIIVGRAVGLPALGQFYLARLVNAVVGIALVLAAIMTMPFGKNVLLAVAILPTTSYHLGSASPDATIIGLGFLALALSLRMFSPPLRARSIAAILASAAFLGLAKGIYISLFLAGVQSFNARDRRVQVVCGAIIIGAAALVAWMIFSTGSLVPVHVLSIKTKQPELTALPGAQLKVIFSNPIAYLRTMVTSFVTRVPVYFLQIIGRFGWNAIVMPLGLYLLASIMLISSLFVPQQEMPQISLHRRVWWLILLAGGAVLVETALYLTGTPLGSNYIQGTQGRYFLPYLPLLFMAFLIPERTAFATSMVRAFPLIASLVVVSGLGVDLFSFWIAGYIKYLGMPPISWSAAGLGRALILPSGSW